MARRNLIPDTPTLESERVESGVHPRKREHHVMKSKVKVVRQSFSAFAHDLNLENKTPVCLDGEISRFQARLDQLKLHGEKGRSKSKKIVDWDIDAQIREAAEFGDDESRD